MARLKLLAILVAMPIIMAMLVLPLLSAFGTDEDLKYQIHNPGTCSISIYDTTNSLFSYNIAVSVRTVGNSIYTKFDGTPQLPPAFQYGNFGNNACARFGLNYNELNFWNLVKYGTIEGPVDYCPNGAIDPDLYDGLANLKCNLLCTPEKGVCISVGTLAKCSPDGKEITHEECVYGCENDVCRTAENTLVVQTDQVAYALGESINVVGTLSASGKGIEGITVVAQLLKTGVLSELQGVTDVNGNVNFTFSKPASSGETTVKLIVPNYLGRSYEATKIIQIVGNAIQYQVATYAYTQYSSKNITFTVLMKDTNGLFITPAQLTNLHAVSSLTQGNVYSGEVVYKGEGLYEISSMVDGSGKFVGKIAFNFEGLPQSSPIIEIDVRPMGISIDTSKISPGAYLDDVINYTVSIFDSSGEKLDPDGISVKVSLPDGTTVKEIPFTQITRIDTGVYTFTYTFTQVEKHTFDIYADYKNYARGSARASVAVSGAGDDFGPGLPGIGSSLTWALYAGIGIIILYFIFRKRKK